MKTRVRWMFCALLFQPERLVVHLRSGRWRLSTNWKPVKRGIYGGAVGYLSWQGNMDTAIAIRTAVIKDGTLHIQAGAGVVADSIPALEWEETMNKARAVFRAVAMAEGGL